MRLSAPGCMLHSGVFSRLNLMLWAILTCRSSVFSFLFLSFSFSDPLPHQILHYFWL
uniref:Uncharacterized protein n=1 Tax=Arundo donax TaxID=35708 RepID=A0A0A9E1E4_ARUDO